MNLLTKINTYSFCFIALIILLPTAIIRAQSVPPAVPVTDAALQKTNAGNFDQRGYGGASVNVDGKLNISNSNGNVTYSYPISNRTIQGFPMTTTLNYCGSVGFTAFSGYEPIGQVRVFDKNLLDWVVLYQNPYDNWRQFRQTRPAWIIGFNGFALQVLGFNQMFCINSDMYLYDTVDYKYPENNFNWSIEGYDYCNRMQDLVMGKDQDVIKLLRADGSILELRNANVQSLPPYSSSFLRPELFTGHYYVNEANAKGFGIVEFSNAYLQQYQRDEYSKIAIGNDCVHKGSDSTACRECYPYRPRVLHYYPGDGLEYIFSEWVSPYGRQHATYNSDGLFNLLQAQRFGNQLSQPTIFYLEEVKDGGVSLTSFNRSRHKNWFSWDRVWSDTTKGRAPLTDFDGHQFTYFPNSLTIEALGRTITVKYDTVLKEGYRESNEYAGIHWGEYGHFTSAQNVAKMSVKDEAQYRSCLGMVTSIIDPERRTTKFGYENYYRNYLNCHFPFSVADPSNDVKLRNYRLTSVIEPAAQYKIHYLPVTSNDRDLMSNSLGNPFAQLFTTNIVDEVKKYSKEKDISSDNYITKTSYSFSSDTYGMLTGETHMHLYDKASGKTVRNHFNFYKKSYGPIIADDAAWRTPALTYSYLMESNTEADSTFTYTKTIEDNYLTGISDELEYVFLPVSKEVKVQKIGVGPYIRKSFEKYKYTFDTVRTYDGNANYNVIGKCGKEVLTDTTFVYRPNDTSASPLFYKVNNYLHLPLNHEHVVLIDSIYQKIKSQQKFRELRAANDPDFVGKAWERVSCDPRLRIFIFDTLSNDTAFTPLYVGLLKKTMIFDSNDVLLQGKSTKFQETFAEDNKLTYCRGLAKADTIIGRNGIRKITSGLYDYSKWTRRGGGLISVQKNANNARHEIFYDYNQPINYIVQPGETCADFFYPKAWKLDNINEIDTVELTGYEAAGMLYESPIGEESMVRKYKVGSGGTISLDSTKITQLFERGYFGQAVSSVNPNGWLSKYTYDNNGRLVTYHLPGDFATNNPTYTSGSYHGVETIKSYGATMVSYSLDSVYCRRTSPEASPERRTTRKWTTYENEDNGQLYASGDIFEYRACPCGDPSPINGQQNSSINRDKSSTALATCTTSFNTRTNEKHHAEWSFDLTKLKEPETILDSVIFKVHITSVIGKDVNMDIRFPKLDTVIHYLLSSTDTLDGEDNRNILDINLTSKIARMHEIAETDSTLDAIATVLTQGGRVDFARDAEDTQGKLVMGGAFRDVYGLSDYTMKYTYSDNTYFPSEPPVASVSYKTDDRAHTSSNWAGNSEDGYTRKWLTTNRFGVDYQVSRSFIRIGSPDANHYDSVSTTYDGLCGAANSVTDQDGNVVRTYYDELGRPDSVENADGTKLFMKYDMGYPSNFHIADSSSYYGLCSRKMTKDEKGLEVRQYFDAFDRLRLEVVDSGGLNLTTKYEYDLQGRLKKVTNPKGQITTYWYDDFGRVKYKHQPDMGVLSYGYDNVGNTRFSQTQEQSSNNKFTYYQYDDLNRVTVVGEAGITKTIYPDTTLTIGDDLNLHRWTDSLNATILHDNSNSAILTSNKTVYKALVFGVPAVPVVAQPANHPVFSACITEEPYYPESTPPTYPTVVQGTYGSTSANPYSTTTANFEDISTHPEHVRMVAQYDEMPYKAGAIWGNFTPTDRAGVWDSLAPKGKVRNLIGQQAAVAYRDKFSEPFHYQVYSYDERGRVEALLRFTSNLGYDAVYYEYNSANQVVKQTVADSWRQSITWYGYDYNGRIDTVWTKITANGTGLLHGSNTSSLDSLKRPYFASKTSDCAQIVYTYNHRGMVESMKTIKPGLLTTYDYGVRGFLDKLECKQGTANVFKEELDYDVDGQIIAQHWKQGVLNGDSMNYVYDVRKQLTQWVNTTATGTYTYDYAGNRLTGSIFDANYVTTTTSTYNHEFGKNRLTSRNRSSSDTTTYTYFKDGSLKSRVYKEYTGAYWNNKTETYGYGYNGLLTSYTLGNGYSMNTNCYTDGGDFKWNWEYRYSPTGERESKRLTSSPLGNGVASHNWNYYLLSGNTQLAVYNGRETSRSDCYSAGNRVYFYPSEYLTYGYGASALLTTRSNGYQEYKITDHLGSTRAVLDSSGYILSSYDYEPFGGIFSQIGNDTRKSFIDKEKDYESGTRNHGVRQYSENEGDEFTTIDPKWEKYRKWSPYQYSLNSPLGLVDPSGKDVNMSGLMQAEQELRGNNSISSALMSDLSNKTGVELSVQDGMLVAGAFIQDANGRVIGSETARRDLLNAINDHTKTLEVTYTGGASAGHGEIIGLNPDKIEERMSNTPEPLDKTTQGYGMTFLHELQHTTFGMNSEHQESNYLNGNDPYVQYENKIRRELGPSFGERIHYAAKKQSNGIGFLPMKVFSLIIFITVIP